MSGLNYNHLYYFYRVALDGGVTAASRHLHLTPQTISGQLTAFEDQIGFKLFERQGKRMLLSRRGQVVFSYAEDMFHLGEELKSVLRQPDAAMRLSVAVGIVDVIPKALSYQLLKPVTEMPTPTKMTCREGAFDLLLAELAVNRLDIVLSDSTLPANARLKAFNHSLLETPIGLYAAPDVAERYSKAFPQGLDAAPFLMPNPQTRLSQILLSWFDRNKIQPFVVGEFDDSALAKAFAQKSLGILAAPSSVAQDLQQSYGLEQIGVLDHSNLQFFAISLDQKVVHPAVKAIIDGAQGVSKTNN